MAIVTKSPIDTRDHWYKTTGKIINLPESVDLRVFDRDGIQNQLHSNSCVANATCSVLEILLSRAGQFRDLSRLFHYYNVRELWGMQNADQGAKGREAMKVACNLGICSESLWPFDLSKVNDKPPQVCYDEALKIAGGEYCALGGDEVVPEQDKRCALAEGYPIFFCAELHQPFMSLQGSTLEETADKIASFAFGRPSGMPSHAMVFVGYRMYKGKLHYLIENSWDTTWGCGGYALAPVDWLAYCSECWIIHSLPGITLPTLWTPQLEGQKPKPIKPVRPKEREVAPNGKKHTMTCTIRRWVDRCFGREPKCRCGALR
jgi:Papain family cysteine protease